MQDKNFCTLKSFHTLEELLTEELFFSKNLIKKYFTKKRLKSPVRSREEIFIPLDILNFGYVNESYTGTAVPILKEDEYFIAINKPSNMHGHPLRYSESNTIVNFIRSHFKLDIFLSRYLEAESGLLYRLDSQTSGVLIFSKSMEVAKKIRSNFNHSTKQKIYIAVVSGKFNKEGAHSHYLESFGEKGSKMRVCELGSKKVEIMASLIKYNESANVSLIKVELGQGVRHQIRCQLSAIGFPILGDTLYGALPDKRVFLHAYKYEIEYDDITFSVASKEAYLFFNFFDLNSCL